LLFCYVMTSIKSRNNVNNNIIILNGVQYKLSKVIDATATNIHHIISQKEYQQFDVQNPLNKMKVKVLRHDALNRFFGDRQNPKKQLEYLLKERRGNVLSIWVQRALHDILSLPNDVFYKKELIKGAKNKNKDIK